MDAVKLHEFFRSVSSWPKTKSELASVAEKAAKLLDVPLVAICSQEDDEKIGFSVQNGFGSEQVSAELLEEMLKTQLRRTDELLQNSGGDVYLRQIQISRETTPLANLIPYPQLTLAAIPRPPISHDPKSGFAVFRKRKESGWIIVASSKPLGIKEQVLLISIAQKLSELVGINRLEAAIQLRNQFLSIASHELKTPLTSIYGILQLQERMARMKKDDGLAGSAEDEERKRSFLKIMIRQVERLNELIDGLLDVSRIQNGRFMVEPTETDVAVVVRDAVNSRLTVIAHEATVTLHMEGPDSFLAVVDPVRLEEVVTNLVMNAIRFSPEGGVVWVKLKGEGGSFRLTIRDQGPSVPVEDRERIFQPFERAQRTSRLGGLGLGLFISRQIAQLHGGNVSLIESVPGKGNVFEAYFPAPTASNNFNAISA